VLTIRSLVADEALELRVLAAGRPGALDADVVWVHNTELLDPSPYLRQRELVLTNGLWHEGAESSATFVANVVRAGGAGIVFGLREQAPTTPPDLIAACRDAELPLLEISATVPFTAVSRAVATVYAERRQRALLRTVRRGDALAEAISVGSGPPGCCVCCDGTTTCRWRWWTGRVGCWAPRVSRCPARTWTARPSRAGIITRCSSEVVTAPQRTRDPGDAAMVDHPVFDDLGGRFLQRLQRGAQGQPDENRLTLRRPWTEPDELTVGWPARAGSVSPGRSWR